MTDIPALADLLEVALEAALAGGRRTLEFFQKPIVIETKPDASPVTAADRASEAAIREVLARSFPTHSVLGEEGGETRGPGPVRWIVDPIDGTASFVRGVPLYGVLVAAEIQGESCVGVIHLPALGETVAAARGLGCTWNGHACRVSSTDSLDRSLAVVTDEAFVRTRGPGWDRVAAAVAMRRTWADAYGYALVATGRAEIAIDPLMKIWDNAPLLPILEEAGGRFSDWRGRRVIDGGDAVATNGILHERVLELLGAKDLH